MGGADRVDVEAFHLQQLGTDLVKRDGVSVNGMRVVTVDTLDLDGNTVDKKLLLFGNFNVAEADPLRNDLVCRFDQKGVKIRLFRVPKRN